MPKVIPEYREEAKKKIIAAGYEVMSQKGYNNTTLEDIASHIGVSKTTLYLYFTNKEDLIVEIIRNVHQEINNSTMEYFKTAPMLDAYVKLLDLFIFRDLNKIGFTYDILALATRNPEVRKIHQEHTAAVIERATYGIDCLQKRGAARTDVDPRTIALTLVSLVGGMNSMIIKGIDPDELRKSFYVMGKMIIGSP